MTPRLLLAISLTFVVAGIFLVVAGGPREVLLGVSSIVFFGGLCALAFARRRRDARWQAAAIAEARLHRAAPFVESERADLLARLADHRATFATSLVGSWHTTRGTADSVMSARWDFRADGTLLVVSDSALFGRSEDVYRWRAEGPFRVALGLPPDEEAADVAWTRVLYDFAVLATDEGESVVLHEVGAKGFWMSDAPLRRDP